VGRSDLKRLPVLVALLLCAATFAACASPTSRLRDFATDRGLERRTLVAGGFELTVFENAAFRRNEASPAAALPVASDRIDTPAGPAAVLSPRPDDARPVLHVYLEGDGLPWMYRVIVTPDPTPRRPLMLGLMSLDEAPAVYIGRPCYNGTSRDAGCDDALWTSARYSDRIVDSMAEAIRALAERHDYPVFRLFGHSGGGTLALLLAARLSGALDVVTIAGNLDTDAWTVHHGYSPLRDSLNPATEPELAARVTQWHLLGGGDRVVPPALVRPYIERAARATGVEFPSFTHGCCWSRVWPGVLRAVRRGDEGQLPGRVFRRAAEQDR